MPAADGLHRDDRVGVVRRRDDDRVNAAAFRVEHLPEVRIALRLRVGVEDPARVIRIHVAQRRDILRLRAGVQVGLAHAADADAGEVELFVRRGLSRHHSSGVCAGRGGDGGAGRGCGQKGPPGQVLHIHGASPFANHDIHTPVIAGAAKQSGSIIDHSGARLRRFGRKNSHSRVKRRGTLPIFFLAIIGGGYWKRFRVEHRAGSIFREKYG